MSVGRICILTSWKDLKLFTLTMCARFIKDFKCVFFGFRVYLEGQGDLVSRLITRIVTLLLPVIVGFRASGLATLVVGQKLWFARAHGHRLC